MTPEKKVAFIPEANRGLGLQTACELGRLCIVSPDPEARKTAPSCDVTKPEDRRAVRDHFERRCGKLAIPLNNAAIFMEREGSCATAGLNRSNSFIREPGRNFRGEFLRSTVGQSPD